MSTDDTEDRVKISKFEGDKGSKGEKSDIDWDTNHGNFGEDEAWPIEDVGKESPSLWDPKQFDQQTGDLDPWKESNEPTRVQDLPPPALAEAPKDKQENREDQEGWPFKSPCAMDEKKSKRRSTPKAGKMASPDQTEDKFKPEGRSDKAPSSPKRLMSEDEDIDDEDDAVEVSKMRDSRHSRKGGTGEQSNRSERRKEARRRSKKKDEPISSQNRSNDDDELDEENAGTSEEDEGTGHQILQKLNDEPKKPRRRSARRSSSSESVERTEKPRRRSARRSSSSESVERTEGEEIEDELKKGSFHGLAKDFDKKPSRARSRGRKSRSSSKGRRRRVKDKSIDHSSDDKDVDETHEELGEDDHEVRLNDDDDSAAGSRMTWRERRAQARMKRAQGMEEDSSSFDAPDVAPGSGGRRTPGSRRAGMRRASSERWRRTVEAGNDDTLDISQRRAQRSLMNANGEISRSAHRVRRYHSGGVGRMASNLDTRTYHGSTQRNQMEARRTPRRRLRSPERLDSAGSFEEDDFEYEMNRSGRSVGTLDSIEDLEDFEHVDFQTPGMVDFEEEINDLMQRANPEVTAQLNRRVHRKREAVHYDQDMPLMTRQALLTRQASAQVMRGRVDGSSIDRKRLMLRSDSMSSTASREELSFSSHRSMRGAPGRRAPPRAKSSGLGAMATSRRNPGFMEGEEDRRGVFRTRSSAGTSSFRQYQNKPNRIARVSRRAPGSEDANDPPAGGPSAGGPRRSKSMTAIRPGRSIDSSGRSGFTPTKPERRVPKKQKEEVPDLKSASSDSDDGKKVKRKQTVEIESSSEEEFYEESEVESDGESDEDSDVAAPPQKPLRRKNKAALAPTKVSKKPVNKRDMSYKRNRRNLHSIIYEAKMGIDMKDLFEQVQKGEIPRPAIKSLLMPSP